ncbi:DUF2163 domain-containing protein [Aquibium sp. LZ166]|uniref:DUF2163 domain-containing protein n=1 Tax=Aquibium pacificus TaxID=3153579 RepID=A0ABV3SN12_9HYPH
MSGFPEAFLAHLGNGATTVCHCWRLTRKDGDVIGFTDHDRPVAADGTAFLPQTGFTASEARDTLGLASDAVDVEGAISSDVLRSEDIAFGRYDGARVETLLVNWREPDQFAIIRTGRIGRIRLEDGRFIAELESPKLDLDKPRGRYFRRGCDAELGDARCGVDLSAGGFNGSGTVSAKVTEDTIRVSGLGSFEAGWFSHGLLACTTGVSAGIIFRIIVHRLAGGEAELTLWCDTAPAPAAGDAFTVKAGCDKAFSTCKAKFANDLNFQGFPHLPGNDAAYGYATEEQIFDGSPLVP